MRILAWPAHKNSRINPYQHLLYEAMEESGHEVVEFAPRRLFSRESFDVLHVHWPDAFVAADTGIRGYARTGALRVIVWFAHARGIKIIWTAHNFRRDGQRNSELINRWVWPWWIRSIDGVIYLSHTSKKAIELADPAILEVPSSVIPHGNYLPVTRPLECSDAIQRVGSPIVLYIGTLNRYKRPSGAIKAFGRTCAGSMRLVVAGEPSPREPDVEFEPSVRGLSRTHRYDLRLRMEFLSDPDLVKEVEQADLVIFPYGPVYNSGAVLFALSAGRPVLTTAQPAFEELRDVVGARWIWIYEEPLSGRDLESYAARAASLRGSSERPDLSALNWTRLARRTAEFCASVLNPEKK